MNQILDEQKTLEWVDLFSDYLITFIGNAEAFQKFVSQRRAASGEGVLNIKVENKDAELKTQKLKEGIEIAPEVDLEMKAAYDKIMGRIATKKKEEFKDIL